LIGKRFNPRKLNELEVRKEYQIQITNRLAYLENLNDEEDVNRTRENDKENIKTSTKESLGLHELKQHKPWFDEECLGFLDQTKRAKKQWIQDPSRSNVDNLNKVRREVSRHFRVKKDGLGMWRVWVRRGGCIWSWWGNRRERDHWGDLGVEG